MAALVSASAPTSLKTAPQRSGKSVTDDLQFAHDHPSSPDVNPIHAITQGAAPGSAEVHVIKVTDDAVRVRAGTPPQSVFNKVGGQLLRVVTRSDQDGQDQDGHDLAAVGPPPPSPPASEEQDTADTLPLPPPMKYTRSEPGPEPPQRPPFAIQTSSSVAGPSTSSYHTRTSTDSAPASALARSSTSRSPPGHHTDTATETDTGVFSISSSAPSKSPLNTSADGYLQPPSSFTARPSRRHTTDSAPSKIRARAHSTSVDQPDIENELADDIKLQAEQIRREKQNRRAQQQREAEEALTRAQPTRKEDDEKVLVGNLIGEGHANYVMMYNMLTGIRIAVSRCQAKIKRPLTDEDFTARHKYSFDIVGNELTPSAKYDFKFKDYAPWVFRDLREDTFHLDPADYLLSLTAKYILSELGSPGKSGSFFYFSRDYRFIIKTIHHNEHKYLLSVLKTYHKHVKENPHTLLSRFYGLHRVKLPRGKKIHFVIMNNLFPAHKDIHETYDLKGSTIGRLYPEEKARENPRATLKDLNWINRGKSLELGPYKRSLLTEQLRRDAEFCKELGVMDYSLLVGIHNKRRGNRDNVRRNTLKVFSPDVPRLPRKPTHSKMTPSAIAVRRAMRDSNNLQDLGAGSDSLQLPEEDTGDRQHFIFYQDDGGLQATDERNENMDMIYYLGVIDILTPWTVKKQIEGIWKGLSADRHKISPVPPHEYGDRFFAFMKAIMRGGEGGEKFKGE